jgi:hypothetical protein
LFVHPKNTRCGIRISIGETGCKHRKDAEIQSFRAVITYVLKHNWNVPAEPAGVCSYFRVIACITNECRAWHGMFTFDQVCWPVSVFLVVWKRPCRPFSVNVIGNKHSAWRRSGGQVHMFTADNHRFNDRDYDNTITQCRVFTVCVVVYITIQIWVKLPVGIIDFTIPRNPDFLALNPSSPCTKPWKLLRKISPVQYQAPICKRPIKSVRNNCTKARISWSKSIHK